MDLRVYVFLFPSFCNRYLSKNICDKFSMNFLVFPLGFEEIISQENIENKSSIDIREGMCTISHAWVRPIPSHLPNLLHGSLKKSKE